MKQFYLLLLAVTMAFAFVRCDDDDNYSYIPKGDRTLTFDVTGRVGTVVDQDMTFYIKSLNVLVFRMNRSGIYTLYKTSVLTEADLKALEDSGAETQAGFTTKKTMVINELPVGTYQIVGVGNILEDTGGSLEHAALEGVTVGNSIDDVIASISNGEESPRLFYGITLPISIGAASEGIPTLTLTRKISMFVLTLKDVPDVVTKIELVTTNTYGAFNMSGTFLENPVNTVNDTMTYSLSVTQDSLLMTSLSLPTITNKQSSFTLYFKLDNGQQIVSPLPKYVLKENTITKLTATIDTEQPGGQWIFNLTFGLTVDVEWNVDQEPPVII